MARVPALLIVSLLSAGAAFAQTAPPTQASIREVMNRGSPLAEIADSILR